MLTTSVIALPVYPFHWPEITWSGKRRDTVIYIPHVCKGQEIESQLYYYHLAAKFFHVIKNGSHVWHYVNAIYEDWPAASISQGRVQNSSIFREVDFLSTEHGIARLLHLSRFSLKIHVQLISQCSANLFLYPINHTPKKRGTLNKLTKLNVTNSRRSWKVSASTRFLEKSIRISPSCGVASLMLHESKQRL